MKSVSGKEFAKILERHGWSLLRVQQVNANRLDGGDARHGWSLLRVQGSHHIYGKAGNDVRLSVPIHGNQTIKTGLLRHLMKLARIGERDL